MTKPFAPRARRGRMRLSALLLAMLLTACGSSGDPSPLNSTEPRVEGSWQLVFGSTDGGNVPILEDHPITLTITGTEVGGTAACNHYGGRFVFRDGEVVIDEVAMTAMGCEERVAAAESAYVTALSGVTAIGRDGELLIMRGPDVELRFEPLPPAPTAELVDTTWALETLVVGDVASSAVGERATLELHADGTLSGSTGCRGFDGEWIEDGEQILATTLAMEDRVCPAGVTPQDSHVVSVIGDGFVPSVEGDLLTLTDPGGVGLVYRAQH